VYIITEPISPLQERKNMVKNGVIKEQHMQEPFADPTVSIQQYQWHCSSTTSIKKPYPSW